MKMTYNAPLFAAALATFAFACGDEGDDSGNGSGNGSGNQIDLTDFNAVSQALSIPGATRESGAPPAPTGGADAPTISAANVSVETEPGGQFVLNVNYDGANPYTDCYVQVEGADDYFVVPGSGTSQGNLQIPIETPSNLGFGGVNFYTCIADDSGNVSNPISTTFFVNRPFSVPSGFFCASDQGGAATCPNGRTLDFCLTLSGSECFYVVGGQRVDCGNCQTGINDCVTEASRLCSN